MKNKRCFLSLLLCGLLVFSAAFSSMAGIGGEDNLSEEELETYVTYDEISLMSVNDDLADYIEILPLRVMCTDLPASQYGNSIHGLSGTRNVYFDFNPYILNNYGSFGAFDLIFELTFSDGYDRNSIGVVSSTTAITDNKGFTVTASGSASNTSAPCDGFSYVDDNTIRIFKTHTFSSTDKYVTNFMGFTLKSASYLKGNSVICRCYVKPYYSRISTIGGDGGSGSGSGGGAAT